MKKVNNDEDVYVVNDGNKLKIGPFKIKGNATSYKYTITGKDETGKIKQTIIQKLLMKRLIMEWRHFTWR